ncbi:flagellin N-terminal helical domain-containing protein [Bacillus sp. SG-1]|uniref:flagellin N-terminal helical domain-containing protein n=1 Tax=Bacillus sp. SG-1 TaxID=161544 RepID=UPI0001544D17|nr:flagellin [Bacillus sp. SG-1]EDL63923.1 hypothetical protein BSG1_08911 [Bacillus sp. SG-1]
MRINHNIEALNTFRQMGAANKGMANSMEKLSSGLRINKAGDDAAGLAISEKMRGQIRGLEQAGRNAQDGISMIQTAEGALNETHSILQRMRELAVQASNDTNNTDDRKAIGDELVQLKDEIDRISSTTEFNGKGLLDGSLSTGLHASNGAQVGDSLTTSAANAISVSKIDVSGAVAGTNYTFSDDDSGKLTLSATISGKTVSQSIDVADMTTSGKQTLDFNTLGISIELTGGGTGDTGTVVANDITSDLVSIDTAAGDGSAKFLVGSNGTNTQETISFDFKKLDSSTLGSETNFSETTAGTGNGGNIHNLITDNTSVDSKDKSDALIKVLDDAIIDVSTQRSAMGAVQNRLDHTINNLGTSAENLTAAESRIRDVDMAKEMMNQTRESILAQASQAMLAKANQNPQGVLQLLR